MMFGIKSGLAAFAALALLGACATGPDLKPKSSYVVAGKSLEYKGVKLAAGDHVRIKSMAGTFKPKDTGHTTDVRAEAGRTGIVLGGVARDKPLFAGEPLQIVLIRFDAQPWRESTTTGAEVPLKEFEATIHADYMELVKKK